MIAADHLLIRINGSIFKRIEPRCPAAERYGAPDARCAGMTCGCMGGARHLSARTIGPLKMIGRSPGSLWKRWAPVIVLPRGAMRDVDWLEPKTAVHRRASASDEQ